MIAGFTMLEELKNNPAIYQSLEDKTQYLETGIRDVLTKRNVKFRINRFGSMISVHFCDHDITDFDTASKADISLFNKLFHYMLSKGIYLPPSAYESWFLNDALTYEDLDKTIEAFDTFDGY